MDEYVNENNLEGSLAGVGYVNYRPHINIRDPIHLINKIWMRKGVFVAH